MCSLFIRRHFHVSTKLPAVRVRFAPSPTGYIHLGGLRTALYNFLFAKAQGGKFILRIEDTDQKRLVPGAAKQLEADLDWMGLIPDESPLKGGNHGPYTQSERLPLYQQFVEQLIQSGHAYPCFCTERRLEFVKKEAIRDGSIPRYDNRCRQLTLVKVEEKKRQGIPYCIRFKLEPLKEPITDIVYGNVDLSAVEHEGDPVILKQDGFPTYHLANIVDDHLMEITHVLRGTEWLISTPKHVLLYNALNWKPPSYAHLPLIMNANGTKLSKRQDDIRLEYFQSRGFYPESLISLLCLVGGGFQASDVQSNLLSLDQLAQSFRLENITTHSGRLDMLRLDHFNTLALQRHTQHPKLAKELSTKLSNLVNQTFPESIIDKEMLEYENILKILQWASFENRIHLVDQLVKPDLAFLWIRQQERISTKIETDTAQSVLAQVISWLENKNTVDRNEVSAFLRQVSAVLKIKTSDVMKLMRSSLTGLKEGPSVGEIVEILGCNICTRRLKISQNLLI